MARRPSAASASEEVRLALRADILNGRVAPGSPLRPSRIAAAHGTSLTVAREALNRLSDSGLVELRPNQGFRVPPLRLEHWAAVAEARVVVDTAALRASVDAGDVDWEGDAIAAHHRLSTLRMSGGDDAADEWAAAHATFHARLLAACPNSVLLDLCARLWDESELYRRWSTARDTERDIAAEHRQLLQHALHREADAAADLLARHIRRTLGALRAPGGNDEGTRP